MAIYLNYNEISFFEYNAICNEYIYENILLSCIRYVKKMGCVPFEHKNNNIEVAWVQQRLIKRICW